MNGAGPHAVQAQGTGLSRELLLLLLQHLESEGLADSQHTLERESGCYFNLRHFEEKALAGKWEECERYLQGFIKPDDNKFSMKTFFELRKQKYLEALDRHDKAGAVDVLTKELKIFQPYDEALYRELAMLLTLENFRQNESLAAYGDVVSGRQIMASELRRLIEANPMTSPKLTFPSTKPGRLRELVNQSLNWQHTFCVPARPSPEIRSLFYDHTCLPAAGAHGNGHGHGGGSNHRGGHGGGGVGVGGSGGGYHAAAPGGAGAPAGPMPRASKADEAAAAAVRGLAAAAAAGAGYDPRVGDPAAKRRRELGPSEPGPSAASGAGVATAPAGGPPDAAGLPTSPARTVAVGWTTTALAFHPMNASLLLLGCANGSLGMWDIVTCEELFAQGYGSAAMAEPAPVAKLAWGPGVSPTLIGVAYAHRIVQVWLMRPPTMFPQRHMEVWAHDRAVHDVAFVSRTRDTAILVTCGDDATVKLWDPMLGALLCCYDAHAAPVTAMLPFHPRGPAHPPLFLSASRDGLVRSWQTDLARGGSFNVAQCALPDRRWVVAFAWLPESGRLFALAADRDSCAELLELTADGGTVLRRHSSGLRLAVAPGSTGCGLQPAGSQGQLLALLDNLGVHFAGVGSGPDDTLRVVGRYEDADVGPCPLVAVNATGTMMAAVVPGGQKSIPSVKICVPAHQRSRGGPGGSGGGGAGSGGGGLGGAAGGRVAPPVASAPHPSPAPSHALAQPMPQQTPPPGKDSPANASGQAGVAPGSAGGAAAAAAVAGPADLAAARELRLATRRRLPAGAFVWRRLPDTAEGMPAGVSALVYTSTGRTLLALCANGRHKVWQAPADADAAGPGAGAVPWQPSPAAEMINAPAHAGAPAGHCLALSRNDSYVLSASGSHVSLYNLHTFAEMAQLMTAPPVATVVAFHPRDNNIIAAGLQDGLVRLYNVRLDEVAAELRAHAVGCPVTGLAFSSHHMDVLASAAADGTLCVWSLRDARVHQTITLTARVPPPMPLQAEPGAGSAERGAIAAGAAGPGPLRLSCDPHHDCVLVVCAEQLVIYALATVAARPVAEHLRAWAPADAPWPGPRAPLRCGAFSCDGFYVFAALADGTLAVFEAATLQLLALLSLDKLAPPAGPAAAYGEPVDLTAHPTIPLQFSVGYRSGAVAVHEVAVGPGAGGLPGWQAMA